MKKFLSLFAFAMIAVFSLSLVSCGDDDEGENNEYSRYGQINYGQININGKDYACYGYDCMITCCSTWEDGTLTISLPLGELADAKKGEYDFDYMVSIACYEGNKPMLGTNLANYPEKYLTVILDEASSADYESGSAIVKSVKDDDYITIEFKNFKCKASNLQSYTFNGTVKLDYDVD